MPVDPIHAIDLQALDAYGRYPENPPENRDPVENIEPSSDAAYEIALSSEAQALREAELRAAAQQAGPDNPAESGRSAPEQASLENTTYNEAGQVV